MKSSARHYFFLFVVVLSRIVGLFSTTHTWPALWYGIAASSLVFYTHSTITVVSGLLGIAEQGSIKVWAFQNKDEEGLTVKTFMQK